MFAFNVWQDNKLIDTVFYSIGQKETINEAVENVKLSLINHDGYAPEIRVTWPKGQRRTEIEWIIQGNYGYGWEDENFETSLRDAKRSIREYRENGSGDYRLIKRQVKK